MPNEILYLEDEMQQIQPWTPKFSDDNKPAVNRCVTDLPSVKVLRTKVNGNLVFLTYPSLEHGIAETQENEPRKEFLLVQTTKPLTTKPALL